MKRKRWRLQAAGVIVLTALLAAGIWIFSQKNTKEYEPSDEAFGNPLMGYAPCAWNAEVREDVSLLYMDITWAELEPEEGQYNWEGIEKENQLERWREEGKHIILRFVCDVPGSETHMDIPMEKHPDIKLDFETLAASGAMADEITSVEDGVYDAAYLSAEQANAILDETGYDDLTVTDRVDGRDTAFLINKDQTELQEAVNKAIDALTEDGTLSKLTEEFFGEDNFEVAKELGLRD